jgi:hypothetical protein
VLCRINVGALQMLSAKYFRQQVDICLRLSAVASTEEQSSRLIAMAKDYKARADLVEA